MAKKKKHVPKTFESTIRYTDENGNNKTDISANLYHSMLISETFKNLTNRQKVTYLYMKDLYYYVPSAKHPNGDNMYFYFNRHIWKDLYGTHTNGERVRTDIDALIKNGFIEEVENNKNLRQKNVYKYSDKWQHIK